MADARDAPSLSRVGTRQPVGGMHEGESMVARRTRSIGTESLAACLPPERVPPGGRGVTPAERARWRRPAGTAPATRLVLMGGFELICDGRAVALPHSAQRLVAFLALADRPVRRCHAAATLWLDTPDQRSGGNLRTALWRLQRSGQRLVELCGGQMRIAPDVAVDVRALADTSRRLVHGEQALDGIALDQLVDAGELLPGWYDDWVIVQRDRTRQLRVQALEAASRMLTARGRHAEAVVAAAAAVEADPLRESAHEAAIAAQAAAGNRGDALRQYRRYAALLERELDLEPSPELQQLAATLRGSPSLLVGEGTVDCGEGGVAAVTIR